MSATVTRHDTRRGIMSSGNREYHYTVAMLSCGHVASGAIDHVVAAFWPERAGSILPVGATVECENCARQNDARAAIIAARERISHSRASRIGRASIDVYARDSTSPTGVFHFATLEDTPENVAFLRSLSPCLTPLSPTEAR